MLPQQPLALLWNTLPWKNKDTAKEFGSLVDLRTRKAPLTGLVRMTASESFGAVSLLKMHVLHTYGTLPGAEVPALAVERGRVEHVLGDFAESRNQIFNGRALQ